MNNKVCNAWVAEVFGEFYRFIRFTEDGTEVVIKDIDTGVLTHEEINIIDFLYWLFDNHYVNKKPYK